MNTITQIETQDFAVEERSTKVFARLLASFRGLVTRATSPTKDQSYADYLETMAHLTGF